MRGHRITDVVRGQLECMDMGEINNLGACYVGTRLARGLISTLASLPSFRREMSHKVISDAKRIKREEAIRDAAVVTTRELSKDERNIVSSSGTYCASAFPLFLYPYAITACQIVQAIKDGRWTSTQVVTAFIKSAIRAQDETNCVTEGT